MILICSGGRSISMDTAVCAAPAGCAHVDDAGRKLMRRAAGGLDPAFLRIRPNILGETRQQRQRQFASAVVERTTGTDNPARAVVGRDVVVATDSLARASEYRPLLLFPASIAIRHPLNKSNETVKFNGALRTPLQRDAARLHSFAQIDHSDPARRGNAGERVLDLVVR